MKRQGTHDSSLERNQAQGLQHKDENVNITRVESRCRSSIKKTPPLSAKDIERPKEDREKRSR